MTVLTQGCAKTLFGLSTDSKPTGIPVGSTFFESDTGLTYIAVSPISWVISPSAPNTADVRSFGAVGDGVTDDSQAFQDAADSLGSGGLITLGPYDYVVNGLVLESGQSMQGVSFGKSRLLKTTAATTLKVNTDNSANWGSFLKDFQIKGRTGAETGLGLWITDSQLLKLYNVSVRLIADKAVQIDGTYDSQFYGLFVEQCGKPSDATIPAVLFQDSATRLNDHLTFYSLHIEACVGRHLEIKQTAAISIQTYNFYDCKVHHWAVASPPSTPMIIVGANIECLHWYGGLIGWGKGPQVEVAGQLNVFDGIQIGGNGLDAAAVTYNFHFLAGGNRNSLFNLTWTPAAVNNGLALCDASSVENMILMPRSGNVGSKVLMTDNGQNGYDWIKPDDKNRYVRSPGTEMYFPVEYMHFGSGHLGFNNTAPIAKPTVTGSRGANAALASVLTALANYGLIVDSSS